METNAESSGTELSREAKDEIQLNLELGELVFEVESLREENVKHFRLEDGTYQAVVYAEPVHRLNSEGRWENIDNSIVAAHDSDFGDSAVAT